MNADFGWWNRDPDGKKFQVHVRIFGGAIRWERQPGRFEPWEPHEPTEDDWERLVETAERRVPRRTIHPKIIELIRRRGK